MDFSEKWGKDVDDAVQLALHDLKLDIDQVNVIVLEEPSKGFFGIGSKLALVRVEKKDLAKEAKPEKKQEAAKPKKAREVKETKPAKPAKEVKEAKETRPVKEAKEPREARPPRERKDTRRQGRDSRKESKGKIEEIVKLGEVEDDNIALLFLSDMTKKMGLDVSVKGFNTPEGLYFEINGPDCGTIIGKRGQTLDSIQYLTSLVANKDIEKYIRVIVDAENYRSKRERTLEQLANRLGDKVRKSGKSVKLEPMNPYERKVIHATLQKNTSVVTRSEGEEPYRRVIIERK